MKTYDVIIIGGGPAGLSSAIYASREGLSTLVIDKDALGGKLNMYDKIENMPTAYNVDASQLAENLAEQAIQAGAEYLEYATIDKVDLLNKEIILGEFTYKYRALVIATGSTPRQLNIEGENKYIGKGVSYCALCDAPFFKNKTVAVIGGGNSALEEASYLTRFATKVYLIHRRDTLRADESIQKKVFNNPKIGIIYNATPEAIIGNEHKVTCLMVKQDNVLKAIEVDGVFPFIGSNPNSELFKGQLDFTNEGYIITNSCLRTVLTGVYAVGDVRNSDFKQVVSACYEGSLVGHLCRKDIERYGL